MDNRIYSVIEIIIKYNIQFLPEEILRLIRNNKNKLNIQYLKLSILNLDNEYKLIIKFDEIISNQQFNTFINILEEILKDIIIKSRLYNVKLFSD